MPSIVMVGLGGGIGAMLRFLVVSCIAAPRGTLFVNVIGALVIGGVLGWAERHQLSAGWLSFFVTGVLGGFTTFSAFSADVLLLHRSDGAVLAGGYVLISVFGSMLATFVSFRMVTWLTAA